MYSRVEKYDQPSELNMSRTKKNSDIYSNLDMSELTRIKTNNNVSIISDGQKNIDLDKIKRYIIAKNEGENEKRAKIELLNDENESKNEDLKEEKDYDINVVLERARDKRESDYESDRHRKISNTEYDILKNIKVPLIENDQDEDNKTDALNTEEKTLVDLLQTITHKKESEDKKNITINNENDKDTLFKDLIGNNEDTVVMAPIDDDINNDRIKEELENITQELDSIKQPLNDYTQELLLEKEKLDLQQEEKKDVNKPESSEIVMEEEKSKTSQQIIKRENSDNINSGIKEKSEHTNIDKSFYTNSMSFSKSDFEGFEDLEKSVKKGSVMSKIAIVLIILLLIGTILIILNYTLDLKII